MLNVRLAAYEGCFTAANGAPIVATLAKLLEERDEGRRPISICASGGQGVVAIVER